MGRSEDNGVRVEDDLYWRDKGVKDRLGYSLENDKVHKDVEFLVGPNEVSITAHKLILRLSSLVFENLITSHEEQGIDTIKLPNTSPTMFRRLLKFIYSDELEMFELLRFFEVARDFGFKKLPEKTIQVLKKTEITEDNAVLLLDVAKGLGDDQLEKSSLEFIFNNANKVLNSEEFVQISYVSLCQVLLDDRLATEELNIFHAVMRWGAFQCKRSQIHASSENIRGALKDARLLIRYTEMGYDQVLSEVKPSGILFTQEFLQVLKYFVDPTVNLLNIPTRPRALRPQPPKRPRLEGTFSDYQAQSLTQNSKPFGAPTMADRQNEFFMQFCFIDYRDLLNAIQLRYTVHRITLHEVELRNTDMCSGRRIFLPNLESFNFFQKKDTASRLPDRSFMKGLTTKEFLFFEKEKLGAWTFLDLWGLHIDININVKGLNLIEILHDIQPGQVPKKKLTLSYPNNSESEDILASLSQESNLNSLCLTACTIPSPEALNASAESMQTLVLQGVEFRNSISATTFINQFKNLKNLSVFIVNGITLNFQHDLMSQRNTLERIALAKVNLGSYKRKKAVVPFAVCEEMYLDVCAWPPSLGEHFSALFPQLQRIAIRSKDQCRLSARFFTELLEIRTLKRIMIYSYPGKEDTHLNPNLNIFVPPTGVNKSAVHHFLRKAGMDFSKTGTEVPDFIIEKNTDTNAWAVVWDQGGEFDETHFMYSMLDVFFADSGTSKLID